MNLDSAGRHLSAGEEKTVPFLCNLTEMLAKSSNLISFVPGEKGKGRIIPGKIVIHDRNLVQEEVLPLYFNHKSFASFRRQLSYFSFFRAGKSSHREVTYANGSVFALSDILRLKRRVTSPKKSIKDQQQQMMPHYQHQMKNELMSTPFKDVASAVNSGMLHAAKANEKLDSINPDSSEAVTSTYDRTSTEHSSLSQSDEATEKVRISCKRKKESLQKYKLQEKDRARLKKMLHYNKIVPFIHLPALPVMVEVNTHGRTPKRGDVKKRYSD